jgi:hypothetical protein
MAGSCAAAATTALLRRSEANSRNVRVTRAVNLGSSSLRVVILFALDTRAVFLCRSPDQLSREAVRRIRSWIHEDRLARDHLGE